MRVATQLFFWREHHENHNFHLALYHNDDCFIEVLFITSTYSLVILITPCHAIHLRRRIIKSRKKFHNPLRIC